MRISKELSNTTIEHLQYFSIKHAIGCVLLTSKSTAVKMEGRFLRQFSLFLMASREIIHALNLVPPPLGTDLSAELRLLMMAFNTLLQFLLFMMSINPLLQIQLPLRDRLFFDFHGHEFAGRDVFTQSASAINDTFSG